MWLATDPILHAGITADLQKWYGLCGRHWPGPLVSANEVFGSKVDAGTVAWLAFAVSACTLACLSLSLSPTGPTAAAAVGVQGF